MTFNRGTRAAVSFAASRNGGMTWRTAATVTGRHVPTPAGRVPAAIADATDWIALPNGGRRVVNLTNARPTRTVATTGLPLTAPGFELADVAFASATTGWATVSTCAVGTGAHCSRVQTLYRTVDGGATWALLKMPTSARR